MSKWLSRVREEIAPLFADQPIVLVDVGASGGPPRPWRQIADLAWYIGFDPDRREIHESNSFGFKRFILLNQAVTETDQKESKFHLTAFPYCSSALEPNFRNIDEYGFSDAFRVEQTTTVSTTRLQSALSTIPVAYVDWLKLDTQGKDLAIFCSLDAPIQQQVLVLDVEPGVIDFYHGENTFAPTHAHLIGNSFWLSSASFQYSPRISRPTQEKLTSAGKDCSILPGNPTAIEAQYVRTLEHLRTHRASARSCACLWIFSMLNAHYGFALDVAMHVKEGLGNTRLGDLFLRETLATMERGMRARTLRLRHALKKWVPASLRPIARKALASLRSH